MSQPLSSQTRPYLDIGRCVRFEMSLTNRERTRGTAVIVGLKRNDAGEPVNVRLQIDGTGEQRWMHPALLRPLFDVQEY